MKRIIRIGMLVVLAVAFVSVADETFIFLSRTPESAQDEAARDFLRECARRGLDPREFEAPKRIKSPPKTYGFVWINTSSGIQIATMVKYLPTGVESWLSRTQDGKFEPYCDNASKDYK